MVMNRIEQASVAGGAVAVAAGTAGAASKKAVAELIGKIKDSSADVRTKAWQGAGEVGAAAVEPLAEVIMAEDIEVGRAAKRAMWRIVRHAGRPKAGKEKSAVEKKLVGLLEGKTPVAVRREVVWMLSEIGGKRSIKPIAELLGDKELREDARCVLERIPGRSSVSALKAGLKKAPDDFKGSIAQSLRKLGTKVSGIPCVKLVPVKKTVVKPIEKK